MTLPTDARPAPSAPAQPQPGGEDMLHDRVARGIHDALGWAYTEQEWSQPRYRTKLDAAARAAIAAVRAHEGWQCAARRSGTAGGNDPADCDWPHCGCDDHATKVLQSLEEQGLDPDSVRAQALEEAVAACHQAAAGDGEEGAWWAAEGAGQCAAAIRALIAAPPPIPSHDHHLSTWREGVEAAAVVLDALGDHSHDKSTLPGALAALCASQCARHVRDFGAQGRPDLAQSAPRAGAGP
jgi:hypothetical protein